MSSFGDFVAVSDECDAITARIISREVSDGTDLPLKQWNSLFEGAAPAPLSDAERDAWLQTMDKVALASDAFFPFRDNIDRAVQSNGEKLRQF
ncbi:Bifunctional purine biosynthesis protein PURH [Operophtera brumata]|uniref:Bifunctional purine biosynthesis protein PURH n=1 Tax=Operophtera brumata TaxID=104452 RepID=A0A0L7L7Q5_OPEBR|nr:Bifunctional purine biosynthesis protein PURH [Operophtera brumata]